MAVSGGSECVGSPAGLCGLCLCAGLSLSVLGPCLPSLPHGCLGGGSGCVWLWPWHFAALGKAGQEVLLNEPVTRIGIGWCQVMDWELCPGSARGCDGRVSSTGVDGVWVWHLECWEFPIRALPCPQGLTDRYSSGPILRLVQSLSV